MVRPTPHASTRAGPGTKPSGTKPPRRSGPRHAQRHARHRAQATAQSRAAPSRREGAAHGSPNAPRANTRKTRNQAERHQAAAKERPTARPNPRSHSPRGTPHCTPRYLATRENAPTSTNIEWLWAKTPHTTHHGHMIKCTHVHHHRWLWDKTLHAKLPGHRINRHPLTPSQMAMGPHAAHQAPWLQTKCIHLHQRKMVVGRNTAHQLCGYKTRYTHVHHHGWLWDTTPHTELYSHRIKGAPTYKIIRRRWDETLHTSFMATWAKALTYTIIRWLWDQTLHTKVHGCKDKSANSHHHKMVHGSRTEPTTPSSMAT